MFSRETLQLQLESPQFMQGTRRTQTICIDYFWLPQSWQAETMTPHFIEETIVGLATGKIVEPGGLVVLPFTPHVLWLVLRREQLINRHCDIECRAKGNTADLVLCTSTCELDKVKMKKIFEKDMDLQETLYLTHEQQAVEKHLKNMSMTAEATRTFLESRKKEGVDVASIRFIALKRHKKTQ
jgi:hypothetical protein